MVEAVAAPAPLADTPEAQEILAHIKGEPVTQLPQDLYIPPEALRVFLEAFQGPLDLLLYLIKKNNLDILDIPIAEVTRQYMEYVELMKDLRLDLAAEYLVMAAMLAEIKSRLLLPRPVEDAEGDEADPRADLVRRLQEYERFKNAAVNLDSLPRLGRDVFNPQVEMPAVASDAPLPDVTLQELLHAMMAVMQRAKANAHHQILREPLSIRERMSQVLASVKTQDFVEFPQLFTLEEGRMGVVVTFIAVLELLKQSLIEMVQANIFGPIHIRAAAHE